MKSIILVFALTALPVMGQIVEPTKLKITCATDTKYKVYSKTGEMLQEAVESGKTSESIRTTWMDGDTEVRSSKSKSFRNGGKDLVSIGRTVARVTKVTNADGTITENMDSSSVSIRQDNITYADGQKSAIRQWKSETTYRQEGSLKTIVKTVDNGKVGKSGGTETERIISPDLKIVTMVEPADEEILEDGTRIVTEKYELTCAFETVKSKKKDQ